MNNNTHFFSPQMTKEQASSLSHDCATLTQTILGVAEEMAGRDVAKFNLAALHLTMCVARSLLTIIPHRISEINLHLCEEFEKEKYK